MDPEYLFMLQHFVLAGLTPLAVFSLSKKYIGVFGAFLAAVFFMAQVRFFTFGGGRNDIAIFFVALTTLVLFHKNLSPFAKAVLFPVFCSSVILSHYSASYIFLGIIFISWIVLFFTRTLMRNFTNTREWWSSFCANITFNRALIFFVLLFIWYDQATRGPFGAAVGFVSTTIERLNDFFIAETRSVWVSAAMGVGLESKGIPHKIEFVASWVTIALVIAGIFFTLLRYRHIVASHRNEKTTYPGLEQKIEPDFLVLSIVSCGIMGIATILPWVSQAYDIGRVYFELVVILAPFFVIGGTSLFHALKKKISYVLPTVALLIYLLCTSSALYEVSGYQRNVALDTSGNYYDWYFVHDQEVKAIQWLAQKGDNSIILAEHLGLHRLISQGPFSHSRVNANLAELYQNYLYEADEFSGYIYLRYQSVMKGKIVDLHYANRQMPDYPDVFARKNRLYASNGAELYS